MTSNSSTPDGTEAFIATIRDFYETNKRHFEWRENITPYRILVSEVMLQQTQTSRVVQKFPEFLNTFPSIELVGKSRFSDIYDIWDGLGYNRRAKFLQQTCQLLTEQYNSQLTLETLLTQKLPGIGPNTVGSIAAFAFNHPIVFIETNIRSVFIHEFFADQNKVSDDQILELVKQTLDHDNPREWYWALMDYGVWLKSNTINPNQKSKHYTKQSSFEGSNRQVRAKILKTLKANPNLTREELQAMFLSDESRVEPNLNQLLQEELITSTDSIHFKLN